MNILLWIVFGALVGWVASIIMRTNAQQGLIMDIVIGILGAVIGGWVMSLITGEAISAGFNLYSFIVSLIGAVILLAIVRGIRRA